MKMGRVNRVQGVSDDADNGSQSHARVLAGVVINEGSRLVANEWPLAFPLAGHRRVAVSLGALVYEAINHIGMPFSCLWIALLEGRRGLANRDFSGVNIFLSQQFLGTLFWTIFFLVVTGAAGVEPSNSLEFIGFASFYVLRNGTVGMKYMFRFPSLVRKAQTEILTFEEKRNEEIIFGWDTLRPRTIVNHIFEAAWRRRIRIQSTLIVPELTAEELRDRLPEVSQLGSEWNVRPYKKRGSQVSVFTVALHIVKMQVERECASWTGSYVMWAAVAIGFSGVQAGIPFAARFITTGSPLTDSWARNVVLVASAVVHFMIGMTFIIPLFSLAFRDCLRRWLQLSSLSRMVVGIGEKYDPAAMVEGDLMIPINLSIADNMSAWLHIRELLYFFGIRVFFRLTIFLSMFVILITGLTLGILMQLLLNPNENEAIFSGPAAVTFIWDSVIVLLFGMLTIAFGTFANQVFDEDSDMLRRQLCVAQCSRTMEAVEANMHALNVGNAEEEITGAESPTERASEARWNAVLDESDSVYATEGISLREASSSLALRVDGVIQNLQLHKELYAYSFLGIPMGPALGRVILTLAVSALGFLSNEFRR